MMFFWCILLIFVVLFIMIISSNLIIHIIFNREEKNDFLEIEFKLLLFLRIKKKIPFIKYKNLYEGVAVKDETQVNNETKKENKERITSKRLKYWYNEYQKILMRVNEFKKLMKKFFSHLHIKEYTWSTLIGTGDAFSTGLTSGIFWSIKSCFIGFLSNYSKLDQLPDISITPEYNQKVFHTRIDCIIKIKVGYVILLGVQLIFKYIIGGRKNVRRTSHSRTNENCHGKLKRDG